MTDSEKVVPLQTDSKDPNEKPTGGKKASKFREKGIYLLPNLFTTGALFSGFYAVVASMNGHFDKAAMAIFVAMVLDGLDGRVARMTNTQSDFGAEYDSLADMVSFGVAPALVAFTWSLQTLGNLGWIAAFIYVAGAAIRLARFNTQIDTTDKKFFVGLASPSAAAIVAATVWVGSEAGIDGKAVALLLVPVVAGAGMLMVSNILFYSFKDIDLKGKVSLMGVLGIVLAFAVVSLDPAIVLLIVFGLYAISGPVMAIKRKIKK